MSHPATPASTPARNKRHGATRRAAAARRLRTSVTTVGAVAGLSLLAACSGVTYAETTVPVSPTTTAASKPPATPVSCDNATQSYDPLPSIPASASISDTTMKKIIARGYVTVGVSADTYLFAARNPLNGKIEGFDIDIAKAVATSIFGDPNKVQLRVITAADRIPLLEKRSVDMVVRNMSMTCDRWNDIAFSAEYYRSGQTVLVAKPAGATKVDTTLQQLTGKKVCAPTGTSSLDKLRSVKGPIAVTAPNHTGCLVLFQQGDADAITGDDTVLAGLAAQDPYTIVSSAPLITQEPYGIGVNKEDRYFASYLNTVLAQVKSDGEWKSIYNRWLAKPLGPAPSPPKPVYGRR
ncbi:glutamate ABC transporter substrate-binding protein [Humibacillus sp. DSM 29435]|uniref:glutamate ABC transporter substrate-binding protein n=1 Tax=Humibacillus sp. DSM 29435 TaxID=1869167 RepID=UPI0009F6F552|nr:glutamate ABC transporter substrate-binding protein [Humibacillus sp. DSM 29435]